MTSDELKAIVEEKVFDDDGVRKLRCPDAFKLCSEHGIGLADIGTLCNEEGIRICQCQLGCFK